jgi:hypothetical protein
LIYQKIYKLKKVIWQLAKFLTLILTEINSQTSKIFYKISQILVICFFDRKMYGNFGEWGQLLWNWPKGRGFIFHEKLLSVEMKSVLYFLDFLFLFLSLTILQLLNVCFIDLNDTLLLLEAFLSALKCTIEILAYLFDWALQFDKMNNFKFILKPKIRSVLSKTKLPYSILKRCLNQWFCKRECDCSLRTIRVFKY